MQTLHQKSVDPRDESGPMPVNTPDHRFTVRQLAACKINPLRAAADRLAIERGEDEGMAVHED